jgi:hypothetical protein
VPITTARTTPEWIANLQLVAEPRFANAAVHLTAGNDEIDTCGLGEHARAGVLRWGRVPDGREELEDPHVFGAKFFDWRGMVRMPVT